MGIPTHMYVVLHNYVTIGVWWYPLPRKKNSVFSLYKMDESEAIFDHSMLTQTINYSNLHLQSTVGVGFLG